MREIRHEPIAPTRVQWMASGADIDPHQHDDHQIVYAARGVLTVTTGLGTWVAPANRAIWVPAGTVHAHRAHGTTDLHLIGLPASRKVLASDRPMVLNVDGLLRELILAYTREPESRGPERGRLLDVLLDRLVLSPQQPLHLASPTEPRLRRLCEILTADPADGRTLDALGREVGASARTLTRLFASDMGMSFSQWRTQLRLHQALILLAEGQTVTAVAHRCGWSTTGAFIDAFRNVFGHTPGRHRSAV
ncbi:MULTISPECIES: helix-turn-helix transcriptional regulator [unclassified Streptomyces]|uniref:helix-turn-helix transcriptional regulator n=1 Tax=unclassified Streptomyces TaxID=2593676 RepID=UPI0035E30E08